MVKDFVVLFGAIIALAVVLFITFAVIVSKGVGVTTGIILIVVPISILAAVLLIIYKKEDNTSKNADTRDRYSSNTSN